MKKLMIVDDEELMRQKLETLVDYSLLGLQLVAQARDGSEGERLILTHQPDVVLTDVVMPGKNGLEMIASLQGKTQAKFIILSGYQDFDYVREALRLGAADYVLKAGAGSGAETHAGAGAGRSAAGGGRRSPPVRRDCGAGAFAGGGGVLRPQAFPEKPVRQFSFMNETYVSRLFQKRTGQKFSSYLTACRIQAPKPC